MRKKDFYDLEDQIRDTVKNAFDAINFDRLKRDIGDLNEAKIKLKNRSRHFKVKMKNRNYNQYRNAIYYNPKYEDKFGKYISQKPVGRIAGILYIIFGSLGSLLLGSLLFLYLIFIYFQGMFFTTNLIIMGLLFSFFVLSIISILIGMNLRKRIHRFKQYVSYLNGESYCSIEKLADSMKMRNKFVVKDLRKMINLGMFPQAHIDDKQSYFMLNNKVYEDYLNSQKAFNQRSEDELKKQEKLNEEINDPEKKELRYTIEMGKSYIEQIRSANNSIAREEISTKLYRLENIVSEIFKCLEKNPEKLLRVNKFTNHYLPITLKLVNAYKELNAQPVQGDNIKSAKNEIENTIDTINIAFEKLLDDLFKEKALDISTDISVLETLFKQEGLTGDDFKNKKGGIENE